MSNASTLFSSVCFAGRGAPLTGAPRFWWLVPNQIRAFLYRVWQSVGLAVFLRSDARHPVPHICSALTDCDGEPLFAGKRHSVGLLLVQMVQPDRLRRSVSCQAGTWFFQAGGQTS